MWRSDGATLAGTKCSLSANATVRAEGCHLQTCDGRRLAACSSRTYLCPHPPRTTYTPRPRAMNIVHRLREDRQGRERIGVVALTCLRRNVYRLHTSICRAKPKQTRKCCLLYKQAGVVQYPTREWNLETLSERSVSAPLDVRLI